MAYRAVVNDFDYSDGDPTFISAARNPNHLVLISVLNEAMQLTKTSNRKPHHNYSANMWCHVMITLRNPQVIQIFRIM